MEMHVCYHESRSYLHAIVYTTTMRGVRKMLTQGGMNARKKSTGLTSQK